MNDNIIMDSTVAKSVNAWTESLNSDSQQFYQYQQNKQPPLSSNHWKQKSPWNLLLEILVLVWDRHKHVCIRQVYCIYDRSKHSLKCDCISLIKCLYHYSLNLEQREVCRVRRKLLQYLYRLKTYEVSFVFPYSKKKNLRISYQLLWR